MSKQAGTYTVECKDRIKGHWKDTRKSLLKLYKANNYERFHEYGLHFDYVDPHTFDNQPIGYYRYLLSWGGPADELRYLDTGVIQYNFQDWFDGAVLDITKDPLALWVLDQFAFDLSGLFKPSNIWVERAGIK